MSNSSTEEVVFLPARSRCFPVWWVRAVPVPALQTTSEQVAAPCRAQGREHLWPMCHKFFFIVMVSNSALMFVPI